MLGTIKKLFRYLGYVLLGAIMLLLITVILYRYIDPPFTPLMIIRWAQDDYGINYSFTEYNYINTSFPLACMASEDQKFYTHFGFDTESIQNALDDRKEGHRYRGASTISQQVAKNVFLWPGRSWLRKGLEAGITVLIEIFWSKKRIMEVYMNVVELGPGIYGAEAASRHYYNKPAIKLKRSESAMLAVCLPLPLKRNPLKPSAYMIKRQGWVLRQMRNLGSVEIMQGNDANDKK